MAQTLREHGHRYRCLRRKDGNLLWESTFDKAGGNDEGYAIAIKGNTLLVTGLAQTSLET